MFVRVISGFMALFLKSRTTSTVAFASKSSDKLEARDAEGRVLNLIRFIGNIMATRSRYTKYRKTNLRSTDTHKLIRYSYPIRIQAREPSDMH